jgi:hypothetical protein
MSMLAKGPECATARATYENRLSLPYTDSSSSAQEPRRAVAPIRSVCDVHQKLLGSRPHSRQAHLADQPAYLHRNFWPPRERDFQRQYSRKPVRCHRMTVSGWTIVTAFNTDGNRR